MTAIDLLNIHHTDDPAKDYCDGLDKAKLRADLLALLERFAPLFPDAHEQANGMDDEGFMKWRAGLRSERRGQFAGMAFMKDFGAILMPANMIRIAEVAIKFKVPFGLAFNRLLESEIIRIEDGVVIWPTAATSTERPPLKI